MSVRHFLPLIAITLTGAASTALAAPTSVSSEAAMTRSLRQIVESAYAANGPGATVIVTRQGRTLLAAGHGLADLKAGTPIRGDDRLYLASITKMFTAATVTKLVDQGKLSLDDPLSKFLPGFPEASAGATVRQLLNHSSGVKDLTKIPGFMAENRDKDFTTDQLVALARAQQPTAAPGEAWEYNNTGYLLLGAIIEKVTGKSWDQAVADAVTRPLNLASIDTRTPAMTTYDGADASAKPYPPEVPSMASSAGGLVGNAADLARFAAALHHGNLVSPALYKQMIAPAALKGGKTAPYGFGFRIGRLLGSPTYYQGGAMRGVRTETLYLPREDIFVAVLANSDKPHSEPRPLAERLAAAAAGRPFPTFAEVTPNIRALAPSLGRYSDGRLEFAVFERAGKLWFAPKGESARPLRAAGDKRFFFSAERADWFELVKGADGKPVLRFHAAEDAAPHDIAFAGPMPTASPSADLSGVGRYKAETGVEFTVEAGPDGSLSARQGAELIGPLRAIENGQYAIDGTPMRLEFIKEGGKVTGIRMFRGARTLNARKIG